MKKQLSVVIFSALIVLGIILGFVTYNFVNKKDFANFDGTLLNNPRQISKFEFTGIDKKVFDNNSLNGHFTFVFFGFTHCKYMCPTIMSQLQAMYGILEKNKIVNLPQIVMISIDPSRDNIEQLNKYVKSFNPEFYGATASLKKMQTLTQELGIAYATVNNNTQNYDIEHTGTVMLFNKQGHLVAFFTSPQDASKMAQDYMLLTS